MEVKDRLKYVEEAGFSGIRDEFPILDREVYGRRLVYLDNAATTQKPRVVIDAIDEYYSQKNANIHRGAHYLANLSTAEYEAVRDQVRAFINAAEREEIIFTSGTTDGINLVASSLGKVILKPGDEILLSELEHHSNIVPWQIIADEKGASIKVIPVTEIGEWDLTDIDTLLTARTKIVAMSHVSNALGTINPIEELTARAKQHGAYVLIDGAQAVAHLEVDVQKIACDFYAFSAHKVYGPMGTGVLYGRRELMEKMAPYKGGGEMIKTVSFRGTTYNDLPFKYEAGTPNVEGVLAMGAAIKFVLELGLPMMAAYEEQLLEYATEELLKLEGVRLYGTSSKKSAVLSFNVEGVHPYDLGTLLDKQGIAVRTGHHCTQPLMEKFGVPGTVRASFAVYNTMEEVDAFIAATAKAIDMLK
jgi:cysteine desulfurase / selenocysteine lyase